MIILEGVDKAGKTTLAHELSEEYCGLPILKYGIPDGDPTPGYIAEIQRRHSPAIYDRFYHGEPIYGIIKRHHSYINDFDMKMLDLVLLSLPHIVIYVRPEWEEVANRFTKGGDAYVSDLAELRTLYELYDTVMLKRTIANVTTWRGDDAFKPYTMDPVLNAGRWTEYNIWRKEGMPGVGTINPDYLFIGERYNHNAEHQVTFWSTSGEYLISRIERAGADLRHCHFTNAISEDIKTITLTQIKMLAPRRVICLGQVAWNIIKPYRDSLMDEGIYPSLVPHPAYWSRFRSGEDDEYVEGLKLSCGL